MSPDRFVFPSFLRMLVASLAVGAAVVAGVIAIVDPYGLYGFVDRTGFNHVKPGLTRYQFQIKLAHAVARRPRVVILGNSRAEIGLDPAAPVFASSAGGVYNLAIPGTGIATSRQQLAVLHGAGVKLDTVIAGVEFIDFLRPALDTVSRAAAHAPAPARGPALWRFDALFSLTSVLDAARTLQLQRSEEASVMTAQGFNPLHEYRRFVRDDGYHAIFRQRAQESAAILRAKSTRAFGESDFATLRSFLDKAADSGADIKLVIYPYHAQMLALFESSGLWPLFERWKHEVVMEVAALRRRRPGVHIALVDFSGFGPYNCEAIPSAGHGVPDTTWYWEAGHFKQALGDVVLRRLMTDSEGEPREPRLEPLFDPSFGTPLDAASEPANRARIAAERASCAASQPAIFSDAARYVGQNPAIGAAAER